MTTPDAALLWAREQAADDEWPQYAELIRSGKLDDIGEVSDRAEAHRAGQAHANAERVAVLEAENARLREALRLEIAVHLNTQEERDAAVGDAAAKESQIVAWLEEYGNHEPEPNCVRCGIARDIEAGAHKETTDGR
jgi:hypothetical protein